MYTVVTGRATVPVLRDFGTLGTLAIFIEKIAIFKCPGERHRPGHLGHLNKNQLSQLSRSMLFAGTLEYSVFPEEYVNLSNCPNCPV